MGRIKKTTTIKEALDIHPGDVISLTGGGGKTSLMFAMAKELIVPGRLIITTCTTKMFPPSHSDSPNLFISNKEEEIFNHIHLYGKTVEHICLAREKDHSSGKLRGLHPGVILRLSELDPVTYIIVEADGSAQRSLKAPDIRFEPVIPRNSTLIVPVVGIDALGKKLEEGVVFRSEIASRVTGTDLGGVVTLDTIATLMTHPSGLTHGSPVKARIIPFINKTDLPDGLLQGKKLACKILGAGHPQVKKVVMGHMRHIPVIEDIIV